MRNNWVNMKIKLPNIYCLDFLWEFVPVYKVNKIRKRKKRQYFSAYYCDTSTITSTYTTAATPTTVTLLLLVTLLPQPVTQLFMLLTKATVVITKSVCLLSH